MSGRGLCESCERHRPLILSHRLGGFWVCGECLPVESRASLTVEDEAALSDGLFPCVPV